MDYSKLKVSELKEELKRRGLRAHGIRDQLVLRLKEADTMFKQNNLKPGLGQLIRGGSGTTPSGEDAPSTPEEVEALREIRHRDRDERSKVTLLRKPITTLQYFFLEICIIVVGWTNRLWSNRRKVLVCVMVVLGMTVFYNLEGSHQVYVQYLRTKTLWCLYWIGLGILSSVGLGTGLHTFLLYLGPHIAMVTLAAFECGSVNFPEPPYPDSIVCPESEGSTDVVITIWDVVAKVRLEAIMWGAGTALGELPPYFMAKAARLSGVEPDSEEYEEFETMMEDNQNNQKNLMARMKIAVQKIVQRVGFFGIMACASIPNPLFDLAGITCGHFLVPFWTFFGATLIGKAVIKMSIQTMFVTITFSQHHADLMVDLIGAIPVIGPPLKRPFNDLLAKQKSKLHHKPGTVVQTQDKNLLGFLFEKFVIAMVVYFVISIVNSLAQRYMKRVQEKNREAKMH